MGSHPQNIDQNYFSYSEEILKAVTFSDTTVHSDPTFF